MAFILATLGFSAGIGNLWRFPYLVGKYGGGIFLLFYMLVVFLVAIPLFVSEGLAFYLKPDFDKFTWEGALAAIGHSFFALGVAVAVALVYGSYLPRGSKHVISNAVIIALLSTLIGFMAGLVIFPSIFSFGLDPAAGSGLTFITIRKEAK